MGHDVSYYRSLPYTRRVERRIDPDGTMYFVAFVFEIPPLRIHGSTREEALLHLDEVFDDIIESMLDLGEEIPQPELWPGRPPTDWVEALQLPLESIGSPPAENVRPEYPPTPTPDTNLLLATEPWSRADLTTTSQSLTAGAASEC